MSDNTRSEICYSTGVHDLNIIHFNSPKKLDVKNKNVEYFRNHYLTFLQYDGNLLRRELIDCNVTHASSSPSKVQLNTKDSTRDKLDDTTNDANNKCYELEKAKDKIYRTHPFFLDYENQEYDHDITLVAQLSLDRLHMVESLLDYWKGPLSLALYLSGKYKTTRDGDTLLEDL